MHTFWRCKFAFQISWYTAKFSEFPSPSPPDQLTLHLHPNHQVRVVQQHSMTALAEHLPHAAVFRLYLSPLFLWCRIPQYFNFMVKEARNIIQRVQTTTVNCRRPLALWREGISWWRQLLFSICRKDRSSNSFRLAGKNSSNLHGKEKTTSVTLHSFSCNYCLGRALRKGILTAESQLQAHRPTVEHCRNHFQSLLPRGFRLQQAIPC